MQDIIVSADLFQQLNMERQLRLSIHSVYQDVINTVDTGNRLVCFLKDKKKLMPRGIVIADEAVFHGLKQLSHVTVGFDSLSLIAVPANAETLNLYLEAHPQHSTKLFAVYDTLQEFLKQYAPVDSFYPILQRLEGEVVSKAEGLWNDRALDIILPKFKQYLQTLNERKDIDETLNVLGFGRGLTPSSDDFVLGLSAVLQYTGDERLSTVKDHGEKLLDTTTFISKQMLDNAWKGQYHLFIHQLFEAIAEARLNTAILRETSAYGHTSGIDTLCGIAAGIRIVRSK